jgi:hypothetical protein
VAKKPLTKDSEFLVGDEKWLTTLLAMLFFGIFLYGIYSAFRIGLKNVTYFEYLYFIFLGPAIFFFIKARKNHIYIRINKTGIYHNEQLVTEWSNFLKAVVTQQPRILSIQDNFVLQVEYMKAGHEKGFRRKIPLKNTQNQSEEDVLAAVHFFWNEYCKETGQ